MVPVISTELFAAKITFAVPAMPELSRTIAVAVTAVLKVAVLFSSPLLAPVILIVATVTSSSNNAAPALLVVPTVKVSAATVPVKVTVAGAPSALSITLISVPVAPPPGSAIVPVTDLFAEVSNNKVPEFVIFAVTASLNVAVLLTALTILVAVTAAVNEELLFNVKTSNEVAPTIPVTEAVPDPRVRVKSRLLSALSLSIVAPKVALLLVVVSTTSVLKVTAPSYC